MESVGALMSTIFFEATELANVVITSVAFRHKLTSDAGKSALDTALDFAVDFSAANAKAYNVRYPKNSVSCAVALTKADIKAAISLRMMPAPRTANETLTLMRYNLDDESTGLALEAIIYFLSQALYRFADEEAARNVLKEQTH